MGDDREKVTLSDRVQIEAGIYAHKTLKQIAEQIGKHPASVSREIRRNSTKVQGNTHAEMTAYMPPAANEGRCVTSRAVKGDAFIAKR